MARKISTLPNTVAPDSDYPDGRFKDKVGSNPGTRVNEAMLGDISQFFSKIMRESGTAYNDLPDNEYNENQFYEAILKVFGGLRRQVYEIGSWDMDADQDKVVSTDIPFALVKGLNVTIISDIGNYVFDFDIAKSGADSSGDLQITITRGTSYDNSGFDDTSINRGFVIVEYAPTSF
jgi:hypothetical protein